MHHTHCYCGCCYCRHGCIDLSSHSRAKDSPYIRPKLRSCQTYLKLRGFPFHSFIHHCLQNRDHCNAARTASTRPAVVQVIVMFCWIILLSFLPEPHKGYMQMEPKHNCLAQHTETPWRLAQNQWIKSLWMFYWLNKEVLCCVEEWLQVLMSRRTNTKSKDV